MSYIVKKKSKSQVEVFAHDLKDRLKLTIKIILR